MLIIEKELKKGKTQEEAKQIAQKVVRPKEHEVEKAVQYELTASFSPYQPVPIYLFPPHCQGHMAVRGCRKCAQLRCLVMPPGAPYKPP